MSSTPQDDLMAFATATLLTTGAAGLVLSVVVVALSLARPSKRHIGLRAVGAVLFVVACIVGPAAIIVRIGKAKLPRVNRALAGDTSGLEKAGRHYVFTYSSASEAPTMDLVESEERIHAKAAEYFPKTTGGRIAVDTRGPVGLGTMAGIAEEGKIRIDPSYSHLETVLLHETIHVLAWRVSDGHADRRYDLLNEGLARSLENEIDTASRDHDRTIAAILLYRKQVAVEDLFDVDTAEKTQSIGVKYAVGTALAEALVARYGKLAPGKVFASIGDRASAPASFADDWRATFARAGFDLDRVVADTYALAARWAAERKTLVDSAPRVRMDKVPAKTKLFVDVVPLGNRMVGHRLRVRSGTESRMDDGIYAEVEKGLFVVPRARTLGDRVCLQPVWQTEQGTLVPDPWTCQTVQWAKEDPTTPPSSPQWAAANAPPSASSAPVHPPRK